jgi:hypothetical protein
MALPKAVQRQADEVAAYDKAIEEAANPAQPPESNGEQPAAQPALSVVEPAPSPATAPVQPSVDTRRDDGGWEQKYRTLQGMFSREQQALREALSQANERIDALQRQQQAPAAPPEPKARLVTEKDSEAFGADLIDMARRVAREEFGEREEAYIGQINALTTQLTQQVGQVRETQYATAKDAFFGTLSAAFPNWEAVQASDPCQKWLGSKVPGANFLWNDVLVDAAEKLDSARAIEVFQAYAQTQPRAPQPAPASTGRKSELSRQVTPARSGTSAAALSSGEKRTYTVKEYEAESMQIVRLNKAGRHDEATQIENELNAALLEGRLKP